MLINKSLATNVMDIFILIIDFNFINFNCCSNIALDMDLNDSSNSVGLEESDEDEYLSDFENSDEENIDDDYFKKYVVYVIKNNIY